MILLLEKLTEILRCIIGRVRICISLVIASFYRTGPNKWRDVRKPRTILRDWCVMHNKPLPVYNDEPCSVTVDGQTYTLSEFGK